MYAEDRKLTFRLLVFPAAGFPVLRGDSEDEPFVDAGLELVVLGLFNDRVIYALIRVLFIGLGLDRIRHRLVDLGAADIMSVYGRGANAFYDCFDPGALRHVFYCERQDICAVPYAAVFAGRLFNIFQLPGRKSEIVLREDDLCCCKREHHVAGKCPAFSGVTERNLPCGCGAVIRNFYPGCSVAVRSKASVRNFQDSVSGEHFYLP